MKIGIGSRGGKEILLYTQQERPVFEIAVKRVFNDKRFISKNLRSFMTHKNEKKFVEGYADKIVETIKSIIKARSILKANAPSTIRQKGFNFPLVKTGKLLKNFGWRVDASKD